MATTIAIIVIVLILAEGATCALAPTWVKNLVAQIPDRLLAAAGIAEIAVAIGLLYLLTTA